MGKIGVHSSVSVYNMFMCGRYWLVASNMALVDTYVISKVFGHRVYFRATNSNAFCFKNDTCLLLFFTAAV